MLYKEMNANGVEYDSRNKLDEINSGSFMR